MRNRSLRFGADTGPDRIHRADDMTKNGWVVANAARARVLEEADAPGEFRHVVDLVQPHSRMKGVSDCTGLPDADVVRRVRGTAQA